LLADSLRLRRDAAPPFPLLHSWRVAGPFSLPFDQLFYHLTPVSTACPGRALDAITSAMFPFLKIGSSFRRSSLWVFFLKCTSSRPVLELDRTGCSCPLLQALGPQQFLFFVEYYLFATDLRIQKLTWERHSSLNP